MTNDELLIKATREMKWTNLFFALIYTANRHLIDLVSIIIFFSAFSPLSWAIY
jgi:hypothetical protein